MSFLFVCILIGIAITVFGYFGIWEWPAWPAFAVLYLVFGYGDPWLELSETARIVWMVVLITINIAFWTGLMYAIAFVGKRVSGLASKRVSE